MNYNIKSGLHLFLWERTFAFHVLYQRMIITLIITWTLVFTVPLAIAAPAPTIRLERPSHTRLCHEQADCGVANVMYVLFPGLPRFCCNWSHGNDFLHFSAKVQVQPDHLSTKHRTCLSSMCLQDLFCRLQAHISAIDKTCWDNNSE